MIIIPREGKTGFLSDILAWVGTVTWRVELFTNSPTISNSLVYSDFVTPDTMDHPWYSHADVTWNPPPVLDGNFSGNLFSTSPYTFTHDGSSPELTVQGWLLTAEGGSGKKVWGAKYFAAGPKVMNTGSHSVIISPVLVLDCVPNDATIPRIDAGSTPIEGRVDALQLIVSTLTMTVILFTNNVTISNGIILSDLTEVDNGQQPWYSAANISWGGISTVAPDNQAKSIGVVAPSGGPWTHDGSSDPVTIYGWAVIQSGSNIRAIEKAATPIVLASVSDSIVINDLNLFLGEMQL